MCRARRAPGSNLRIQVRRKRWRRWCGEHPGEWPVRGWPGCDLRCAVRRNGPARVAGRATAHKAGCDFQPANAEEAMALSCSPMYTMDSRSKEPFCLYGPWLPILPSRTQLAPLLLPPSPAPKPPLAIIQRSAFRDEGPLFDCHYTRTTTQDGGAIVSI